MNERDLETRLRSAYRSRAGRTDPGALSERVHSIPATVEPQRRHWWHGFRSGAARSVGPGGTQVRGASNMLTATRIAAIVAALALGTTFLAVQVGEPPDTAQQPTAPASETWVTVTGTQSISARGGAGNGQWLDMSDPRLEGFVSIIYESDSGPEGGPPPHSGARSRSRTTRVPGRGSRSGSWTSRESHRHMGWLEGDGAYDGLVFIEQSTEANPDVPSAGLDVVGLVYEGELPPMVLPAWAAATD